MERVVAVGTVKGAFLVSDDGVVGPLFPGDRVPSLLIDGRDDPPSILAGAVSDHWGPVLRTSRDGGRNWSEPTERSISFPTETGASLAQVWQLQTGGADEAGVLYAGVEPAALFRSDDGGETWSLNRGLWDHPHREQWEPGGGGLCLHTILVDPRAEQRLIVGISTGGVYVSDDGGTSWEARNQGIRADFLPGELPEFGQCVHKVARDAADADRLYVQNHGGLYRSDDGAATWTSVADGVPSDFGFPMVAHPRRGGTVYIIPLESDGYRCVPEGRCRVYRTTDGGGSWAPLTEGLPQSGAHFTVLRDAMCADGADPLGLYFGTRTGQVYASDDEGESFRLLVEHLPPVLCVRAGMLGG